MLKIHIKKDHKIKVNATGTAKDLMLETSMMINLVHHAIQQKNPEAAKEFKNNLLGVLLSPHSPVWKEPPA